MKAVSSLLLSVGAVLATLSLMPVPMVLAQPANNGSLAFCVGLEPGFYCQPADALNVVQCPGGLLVPCAAGRFCASVGQVTPCYDCEAPIWSPSFCYNMPDGTYCGPPGSGFSGVVSCPDGRLSQCAPGGSCLAIADGLAVCGAVPPIPSECSLSTISTASTPSTCITTPYTQTQTTCLPYTLAGVSFCMPSILLTSSTPSLDITVTVSGSCTQTSSSTATTTTITNTDTTITNTDTFTVTTSTVETFTSSVTETFTSSVIVSGTLVEDITQEFICVSSDLALLNCLLYTVSTIIETVIEVID